MYSMFCFINTSLNRSLQWFIDNGYLPDPKSIKLTVVNLKSDSNLLIRDNNDRTATISGALSTSTTLTTQTTIVNIGGIPTTLRPKNAVVFDIDQDGSIRTITINTDGSITIDKLHMATVLRFSYTYSLN